MGELIVHTDHEDFRAPLQASEDLATLARDFMHAARLLELSTPEGLLPKGPSVFRRPFDEQIGMVASSVQHAGMLHRLRPFALSDEPLFVPKILSLARRDNPGPVMKAASTVMRDVFLLRHTPFALKANTQSGWVEFERHWQDYANGYEYHQSAEKRARLEAELGPNKGMASMVFMFGGMAKVKAVLSMRGLAKVFTGEAETFGLDMRDIPGRTGSVTSEADTTVALPLSGKA